MIGHWFRGLGALLVLCVSTALARADGEKLTGEHWYEIRTAHFNVHSCGKFQDVYKVAERLEQFHDAYALLAGAGAVKSPPIMVMVFPDQAALEPFLPLYQGQPANLAAFFKRGSDENLIVLALADTNRDSLPTIFHEYTHLLSRHNDDIWPLWLQEGMAEVYSTFQATGRGVRIGLPIEHHLRLLTNAPLMPLKELLAVKHDSPEYNESEHQGIFYAESWLLTQFLMNGDNAALKARFPSYTKLLRAGQPRDTALQRALGMSLPALEAELQRYLERGVFEPFSTVVAVDLSAPRPAVTRPIARVEVNCLLGDELLRIDRLDTAEGYFNEAAKLAPRSPLPCEGLGMLAAERKNPAEAVRQLEEALQRGSTNFLAHYLYAEQRFKMTADDGERYQKLDPAPAGEIRAELEAALALMPDFAPAHQLLGFLEMVQGENLAGAEEHLQRAAQLEPEDHSYQLSLAQVQMARREPEAARRTLEALRAGPADTRVRARAEEELRELERGENKAGD